MSQTASQPPGAALDTRAIWAIALPAMLTNVATALIGLGDMWIVGQLNDAPTQGAVDIGARLFAMLFVVMNFLKTGTTGLVAQAGTREGEKAQAELLARGLAIGLAIALGLMLAKPVLLPALLSALGAEGKVLEAARTYAVIRYWSAPGVMLNLALMGFLIGRRQMVAVLWIEVAYNVLNVSLGYWLTLILDWGIAGIGWSSFIAEYAKLVVLLTLVMRGSAARDIWASLTNSAILKWQAIKPFLSTNRDLFLRTVVLMLALAALTRLSAERGPDVLAANGILYQMFVLTALLLDGFENAAQVLNGERLGAKDRQGFAAYIRAILWRGLAVAGVVALGFALLADPILASFAATPEVAREAQAQAIWLVIIPFAGVASFVFDGVFVGASWTRAMLASMIGAAIVFALSLWLSWPLGNAGLWGSFVLFLAVRAILQAAIIPARMRASFAD
ncbi:MATE family efflux transporter [Altererythrobacter lutimaris]|uniref:MATE family efflux transporter n=1 Tax=Altererythrobacter lutimaris TaxID=2743979 RepID=A0A850HBT3_9SPHN|nr:MATE family efflux transporter [Altererythrobacter lutimaris]NVE94471.1 MATE family efflux transporter [Altererythrobacter lutimaris]